PGIFCISAFDSSMLWSTALPQSAPPFLQPTAASESAAKNAIEMVFMARTSRVFDRASTRARRLLLANVRAQVALRALPRVGGARSHELFEHARIDVGDALDVEAARAALERAESREQSGFAVGARQ